MIACLLRRAALHLVPPLALLAALFADPAYRARCGPIARPKGAADPDGGAAQDDITGMARMLGLAVPGTLASPLRFERFARRLLGA